MKHLSTLTRRKKLFDPLLSSPTAQAAMMTLKPGQSSSDAPENEHPKAEQWLYVLSGTGRATTAQPRRRPLPLKTGCLLLIPRNEPHQITNTGTEPLITLNLYVPPAYDKKGNVKRSAKK